jgi:hypothetical protein
VVHLSDRENNTTKPMEFTILLDPALLRAARRVYRAYCVLHSKINKSPQGVAIDRDTHRGQIIFTTKPILLPGECFIPLRQLESEVY